MVEKVTISQVYGWGFSEFVHKAYTFVIKLQSFGTSKFPVIHIGFSLAGIPQWDFTIVLDKYEPIYLNSDELNHDDVVEVDFAMFENIFHDQLRQYYIDCANKEDNEV